VEAKYSTIDNVEGKCSHTKTNYVFANLIKQTLRLGLLLCEHSGQSNTVGMNTTVANCSQ
jgi:hypothetical protein